MFRKILVPTDGSTLSEKAMTAAIGLARSCDAKIIGMTIAQPYLYSPLELGDTDAASVSPSAEIVEAAKRFRCDAIFMGSHWRKGLSRLLLGSETQQVLSDTDTPVMVFR